MSPGGPVSIEGWTISVTDTTSLVTTYIMSTTFPSMEILTPGEGFNTDTYGFTIIFHSLYLYDKESTEPPPKVGFSSP